MTALFNLRSTHSSHICIIFISLLLVDIAFLTANRHHWNNGYQSSSLAVLDMPITIKDLPSIAVKQVSSSPSLQELDDFLNENPDTPAALLVPLLRQYLHTSPAAELERVRACSRHRNEKMCFAGHDYYTKNSEAPEEEIPVVLWEDDPHMNMYNFTRYPNGKKHGNLGTNVACIPLILAGFAATHDPNNVVVELGPFLGYSTKCIATGMRKNGVKNNTLYVYDTFSGTMNFNAIKKLNPWLKDEHPEFNQENDNFHFLWEYGVKSTYPTLVSRQGFIGHDTLNPGTLGNRPVALISIDSAKSNNHLQMQIAGIGPLKKGSILMMMDFEFVRQHIILFYACLREHFVMPGYVSWNMEHWMWIVTEDVDLAEQKHYQCYEEYNSKRDRRSHFINLAQEDLRMLSGLTDNVTVIDAFAPARNPLMEKISSIL